MEHIAVKNRWIAKQILVAVAEGKQTRDGYLNAAYPGLSIHHTSDLGWIVTHIESGAAVLAGCPTRAYAEGAVKAFAGAADWTASLESLRHRPDLFALAQSFSVAFHEWARSNAKPMPTRLVR